MDTLAQSQKAKSSTSNPTDAVIFVGISLVLGIASRHLLRGTRVPYTVALLILGIGLGSLGSPANSFEITLLHCLRFIILVPFGLFCECLR
ncbi:hypothetical protein RJ639_018932 [Escallonia herrerae]|uniref:Cation/H+ exchanger domain-containing protein n=1 Tax=Escallonia herrerae TaxID=1293975 RepID=A0AA89AIH0_9ASTE|nr:hypothetical protein RJ639_018932 [Escallonia herrerae]